jgi:ubiquinone/menaquinone biosynthesis C-methylase UbiE
VNGKNPGDDDAAPRRAHDHEKHYMARAGTERWERVKPFSTPGHDDVAEAARLMHDFAVMLGVLPPRPGLRVLDLGAGSCWVSEWLQRLNVETVSIDLSHALLTVGVSRLRPGSLVVAGDLEALPLVDGCCDLAVCLNALHHVPDRVRALASVRRVLKAGGAVFLSEPGEGHAAAETSLAAAGAFGVREEEVPPRELLRACAAAGFAEAQLVPLAHLVTHFKVSEAEWARWDRLARQLRPRRALARMGRGVLELFGVGKAGPILEEALGTELVRIAHAASAHHPIVVARR